MITGSLVAIALALTFTAYHTRRATIGYGGAFGWGVLSFWLYSQATVKNFSDIYFLYFWMTVAIMFAVALESAFMKFGVEGKNQAPTEDKQTNNKEEHHAESIDELRAKHGLPSTKEAKEKRESKKDNWYIE